MTISSYDTYKMYVKMHQKELDDEFRRKIQSGEIVLSGLERSAQPTLRVKKLHHDAIVPTRGTPVAAGLDLYALEAGNLIDREQMLVPTGIAIALPPGYEGQVRPRSGLAAKYGISVVNSPGTIDEDYRGEVKVLLINHGRDTFQWKKGDRIAQLVITKANHFDTELVEELDVTDRGTGGFGSTGK